MLVRTDRKNWRSRIGQLDRIDWDFALTRSKSAFSSLHWYPCRYPSQIPSALIGSLSLPGEVVLDPFLGSGTTAVEAQRLGRACVGIELNPVAALISEAKTIPKDARAINRMIDKIEIAVRQNQRRVAVPEPVQVEKWYTPRTVESLRRIKFAVSQLTGETRKLGEAAFSAILLGVCRETRHWGYVCDNTDPKGDYERDPYEEFLKVLSGFRHAYEERETYWRLGTEESRKIETVKVVRGDSTQELDAIPTGGAQLIVTSPPYFGVADYVKAQRLTLEWDGTNIEPLRLQEIGARSKRRRSTAADEYLEDCANVFSKCRRVLEKGRACAVVFGESSNREPMNRKFQIMMERCGFTLEYSGSRKIAAGRRFISSLKKEYVLVFT